MKKNKRGRKALVSVAAETPSGAAKPALVHPVVIYPFRPLDDYANLQELYRLVAQLDSRKQTYARPITVIDRKTHTAALRDQRYLPFRNGVVGRHSDIVDAWCVDTCQMWYCGLGLAFERGKPDDVYWLIPGDFNYGSELGRRVLGRLHDLPEICAELGQDVCVGEIATDHNNPKQLIDTYGTFALLYTWFPAEAREIRQYTERPRSEFFALRHDFLGQLLHRRWYAYEQTVVTLLHAVFGRKQISRFLVGDISDLPEGRESLTSAIQQVERTERVLKTLWRERHQHQARWTAAYRLLETQSEQVRRTALILLENLLT
ncbi:MAG: hypothetical protein ABSG04_11490 [Verrucomicrobiota bacterium]|jgi:hypothetical protein